MTDILMGTVTYAGKDYCLKEWAENTIKILKPNDINVRQVIIDNSESTEHAFMLDECFGGVQILPRPRRPGQHIREVLVNSYQELFDIAGPDPLFILESDVMPPSNILRELWNFHTENPDVGVIGCLVGYPKVTGDDGAQGNYKWMVSRFLREGEQRYELINALDAEKWDRIRPRLQQLKHDRKESKKRPIRVANMEGKVWYIGFSAHAAEKALRKAMGENPMPMKVHQRELYPDHFPVEPDFEKPAQVEALQWCCTLIMPEVHQKIKVRIEDPSAKTSIYPPDYFFWKDCLKAGVKVYSIPVICRHRPQLWPGEIIENL